VQIGDIHSLITDRELEHMQSLRESVLDREQSILSVAAFLSQVDCLSSFAVCALERNHVRPQIGSQSLVIVKGRYHD
jgi:DNA mismatch repair ATPase MutS